jgi:hypothetical protein
MLVHDLVMESSREVASELRRLLDLAEEIQAKYESAARRRSDMFAQEVVVGLTGIVSSGVIATSLNFGLPIGLGLLVGVIGFLFLAETVRARLQRRVDQEERALGEVVAIVREVEMAMAHEEDWSPLERAEFRIRLSRFEA